MDKTNKPGRPATGTTPARTIRISDREWEQWRYEAMRSGKTLSQWIRDQIHVPLTNESDNDTVSHR